MATAKPRITVTLDQHTYDVLKVITDCGGQPMSAFVSEMLDSARPTLERMAATFQKIKQAQDAERSRFLESVDEAQAALEPVVMHTLGQFDLFLGAVEKAVEGRGAGSGRAAGAPSPLPSASAWSPSTNRGDTPTRGKPRKASSGKASGPVLKKEVLKKSGA